MATLLLIMAIVAGFLAGHRQGFDVGKNQWTKQQTFTVTYSLEHLLRGNERSGQLETFVSEIKSNVMPTAWKHDGNTNMILLPNAYEIVVSSNATLHNELEQYLALERIYQKHQNGS